MREVSRRRYLRELEALRLRELGKTFREVGEHFGVHPTRARDMVNRAQIDRLRVGRTYVCRDCGWEYVGSLFYGHECVRSFDRIPVSGGGVLGAFL